MKIDPNSQSGERKGFFNYISSPIYLNNVIKEIVTSLITAQE
jgi:hypothetical protein